MESVYVLINVSSGTVENVLAKLSKLENISEVAVVTGAYDVIAKVEGDCITDILTTVIRGVRQIEGVISTETLVIVKL